LRRHAVVHVDIYFESNECAHESLVFADEDDVAASWALRFEVVFDWNWGDVLTSSRDNELLHPSGDLKESTLIESSLIASFEITILINAFLGGLLVVEITHHDVSALDSDFTLSLFVLLADLDMSTKHLLPSMPKAKI
jgi:hypothetical protein